MNALHHQGWFSTLTFESHVGGFPPVYTDTISNDKPETETVHISLKCLQTLLLLLILKSMFYSINNQLPD